MLEISPPQEDHLKKEQHKAERERSREFKAFLVQIKYSRICSIFLPIQSGIVQEEIKELIWRKAVDLFSRHKRGEIDFDKNPYGLMYISCKNAINDYFRKLYRSRTVRFVEFGEMDIELKDQSSFGGQIYDEGETREFFDEIAKEAGLSAVEMDLLIGFYVEGRPLAEIGNKHGLKNSTPRVYLLRVRKKIEKRLGRDRIETILRGIQEQREILNEFSF